MGSKREDWEAGFNALKKFIKEHGHCRLGNTVIDGVKLANWAVVQRRNKPKLNPNDIERLDRIGFSWDPKKENWEDNLYWLKRYLCEKGHLSPLQFEIFHSYPIGTLVAALRGTRRKGLTQDQIDDLNNINFIWSPRDKVWLDSYKALKKYSIQTGSTTPPRGVIVDGINIYTWATKIRWRYWPGTGKRLAKNSIWAT